MFTKPSKPFSYTGKRTPRRRAIIDDYAEEIDQLYAAVEESTQSQIPAPQTWDAESTKSFIRAIVVKVLGKKVGDDADLFDNGCDSLQSTWIRNTVLHALRVNTHIDVRNISESFVYNHPSVSSLASFIYGLVSTKGNDASAGGEDLSHKLQEMKEMVDKYSTNFPSHVGTAKADGNAVLLTGTTGGLGSHILAKLAENNDIRQVYAVNRRARDLSSLMNRQKAALVENGLDPAILQSGKVILLEADLNAEHFGLEPDLYQEIARNVTHIIHNAWPVNFNLALSSFEPNIKSVRRLVDFALSSPLAKSPRILFTSSIGVLHSPQDPEPLPECLVEAQVATAGGYAESKWACEQILSRVSTQTPVETITVRVGQLCGGPNGAWNTNEWFPSLVQSAAVLGCLPSDAKDVDWIPSDIAALAIIDFILGDSHHTMVHLVHPRPVRLSSIMPSIAKKLSVKVVSYDEWVEKLEAAGQDGRTENLRDLPALKLLSTYKSMAHSTGGQSFGLAKLDTRHAKDCSVTLADTRLVQLGEAQVDAWIGYWKRKQLLK